MAGGFKRSSVFGAIGILVVMAAFAVSGLTLGSPPIHLPEGFVPLLIGGPLIALAATYGSGREGIIVTRKGGQRSDWMCDLWLAEHLASRC